MRSMQPIKISSGAGEATGASSDVLAIPNASGGNVAEIVAVSVSAAAYILPCLSSGSVSNATGMLVNPEMCPVILNVKGHTHIAHIRLTSDGVITISPVENHH